jgi:23S rRNA (uracil1939-C5)-methyltransferase
MLIQPRLPAIEEIESGQTALTEEILNRRYRVSAAAFFQVNTRREARSIPQQITAPWIAERTGTYSIADLLALLVLDRLQAQPDDVVLDAYCGVGTFGALIAPHVRQMVGVEESPAAIKDAEANTKDLPNTRFIVAKVEHVLPALAEERLDAVVIDPARVGCAPEVVQAIVTAAPRRVVYVSCDPATLARDLRAFRDGGYRIDQIEPIDMFPQTYHIETVTTLSREKVSVTPRSKGENSVVASS